MFDAIEDEKPQTKHVVSLGCYFVHFCGIVSATDMSDFKMKFAHNEAWYGSSVGVEDLIALGGTVFLLMWLVFGAVWVWVMLLRPGARPRRAEIRTPS